MKGLNIKDYIEYRDYITGKTERGFILDIGRDRDGDIYLDIQNVSSNLKEATIDSDEYIGKVQFDSSLSKGDIEFLIDLALNTNDIKWLQELGILISKHIIK